MTIWPTPQQGLCPLRAADGGGGGLQPVGVPEPGQGRSGHGEEARQEDQGDRPRLEERLEDRHHPGGPQRLVQLHLPQHPHEGPGHGQEHRHQLKGGLVEGWGNVVRHCSAQSTFR